jgi:hypothetical protein
MRELKSFFDVGVVKASLNRATKCILIDPKPGDLSMSRLKRG